MNFKGLGGRGANHSVQESIARTQLEAVNRSGRAKADTKIKQRKTIAERLELLKNFATRQVVNNGKEEGVVVELISRLACSSCASARTAPASVGRLTISKKGRFKRSDPKNQSRPASC